MTRGLRNLAIVRKAQYRDEEARALLERARRIALRAPAADAWTLMAIDNDLADLALRRDDAALARRLVADLLRREASGQGQDGQVGRLITRGAIELHDGRAEAARAAYRQALALSRARGEDPLEVAAATSGLGAAALLEGRTGEAISQLERAARRIEKRPGGSMNPVLVPILTDLGRARLAADRPAQAIAALERAVAIADADHSSARTPGARARFALARALWISRDRTRALALATAARGELAGHAGLGEVDGWIRRRAGRPVADGQRAAAAPAAPSGSE